MILRGPLRDWQADWELWETVANKPRTREQLATYETFMEIVEVVAALEYWLQYAKGSAQENIRLRQALERIANMEPADVEPLFDHMTSEACHQCEKMIEIAQEVLGGDTDA